MWDPPQAKNLFKIIKVCEVGCQASTSHYENSLTSSSAKTLWFRLPRVYRKLTRVLLSSPSCLIIQLIGHLASCKRIKKCLFKCSPQVVDFNIIRSKLTIWWTKCRNWAKLISSSLRALIRRMQFKDFKIKIVFRTMLCGKKSTESNQVK